MNTDLNKMCGWERSKAVYLMNLAENDLNMDLSSYGDLSVNPNSGYTYLWLEDYNFTIYMPIDCELKKTDVYALYSCLIDSEEIEMKLEFNTTLEELEKWASTQSELSEQK